MKFISLQRWIYVDGDSVPNALRSLAQEIETFNANDIPEDEYEYDYSDANIEISYNEDSRDDKPYRAGICMSWKIVEV